MHVDVEAARIAPTEVLIPEARQRQHRRYVRTGIIVTFAGIVVAALIAGVVAWSGALTDGKSRAHPAPSLTTPAQHKAPVYFRSVLCIAPPYNPAQSASAPSGPLTCSPTSAITTENLNTQPQGSSPNGFTTNNVPPDGALAGVPSTTPSADKASTTVLLPGLRNAGCGSAGYRCVLGPAEMSSALVRSATVTHDYAGAWVVNYVMTAKGAALWNTVAEKNFHLQLAIELDGTVYSAPLIEPVQSSFSSFEGRGQISGSLTKAQAERLANAMRAR